MKNIFSRILIAHKQKICKRSNTSIFKHHFYLQSMVTCLVDLQTKKITVFIHLFISLHLKVGFQVTEIISTLFCTLNYTITKNVEID